MNERAQMENSEELQNAILKAKAGSEEAFHTVFNLTSDKLFNYALVHTKNREDATDITQESYIELWKSLQSFAYRGHEQFMGFLFIIIKRRLAKYYKGENKLKQISEFHVEEVYEPETENYQHLSSKVEQLPPKHQEVIRLRYWSALTFPEIGATLGIKETTAKVLHHRAIKNLKGIIANNYE
jgi:RNA polymerase sigma factor (sigma-70 family)